MMNFQDYLMLFEDIVLKKNTKAPYNEHDHYNYVKLNYSRLNRWVKLNELKDEVKDFFQNLKVKQNWILITEPWCGDAAHSVPIIYLLSELSEKVNLEIQLRDTDSEIDNYLTQGGKSIPILIIRDEFDNDIAVWGPRPTACQELFLKMKKENLEFEEQKIQLQNWYNKDKGVSIQEEILKLLKK